MPRTQLLKNIATQETLKLLMLIVCSTYRLVLHIACWTIHGCIPQQTSSDIGFPSHVWWHQRGAICFFIAWVVFQKVNKFTWNPANYWDSLHGDSLPGTSVLLKFKHVSHSIRHATLLTRWKTMREFCRWRCLHLLIYQWYSHLAEPLMVKVINAVADGRYTSSSWLMFNPNKLRMSSSLLPHVSFEKTLWIFCIFPGII